LRPVERLITTLAEHAMLTLGLGDHHARGHADRERHCAGSYRVLLHPVLDTVRHLAHAIRCTMCEIADAVLCLMRDRADTMLHIAHPLGRLLAQAAIAVAAP